LSKPKTKKKQKGKSRKEREDQTSWDRRDGREYGGGTRKEKEGKRWMGAKIFISLWPWIFFCRPTTRRKFFFFFSWPRASSGIGLVAMAVEATNPMRPVAALDQSGSADWRFFN
jgi:hypothetical protein